MNGYLYRLLAGTDAEGMEAFQVEALAQASTAWLNCAETLLGCLAASDLRSIQIGAIREVALIDPLGIGIGLLQALKNVAQVCTCQFTVAFPFQAGSAAVVNGIVHGPLEVGELSARAAQRERSAANP